MSRIGGDSVWFMILGLLLVMIYGVYLSIDNLIEYPKEKWMSILLLIPVIIFSFLIVYFLS